jgi:chemotaxis response regulator CheB
MVTASQPGPHVQGDANPDVAVLAVDDQACFREALRDMIEATAGFVLVGEACSGEEALSAVGLLSPDMVVMDVRMPGMDGVTATRAIMAQCPGTVVVLVSAEDPDRAPGADTLGDAVPRISKQHLRPQTLHEIWAAARRR